MNITLNGASRSRTPVLLGGGFRNFFVSASSGDRTYKPHANYDFVVERRRMPYDTLAVAAMVQPFTNRTEMYADEIQSLTTKLTEVIKANEAFEAEVTSYYGARVSRTSGGKRARLRDERAALRNESEAARKMAAAAILDLRSMTVAQVKSVMKTDPDNMVQVRDPQSGRAIYQVSTYNPGSAVQSTPTASKGKLPASLLFIPAGIAAAYFLAKG